jgi:hypothetical protein
MRTAIAARRLIVPLGRVRRRIAAEVVTWGVDDMASIERIVIDAEPACAAGMSRRD